jgi:hypothetical protein
VFEVAPGSVLDVVAEGGPADRALIRHAAASTGGAR